LWCWRADDTALVVIELDAKLVTIDLIKARISTRQQANPARIEADKKQTTPAQLSKAIDNNETTFNKEPRTL